MLLCGGIYACGTSVGDTIRFGGMRWHVLELRDGRALLISEEIIALDTYCNVFEAATWEESDIRRWLNDEFYNQFSQRDQVRIAQTHVINHDNPWYGTAGGNDTTDHIFLLSLEEAASWIGDGQWLRNGPPEPGVEYRIAFEQCISVRIAQFNIKAESWWLRSPGANENAAALVSNLGTLVVDGNSFPAIAGVRPALWLEL